MPARKSFDVVVIGAPSVDLVFSDMPHWPAPGKEMYVPGFGIGAGAAFNTAATLSRLGLRVGLLSELGNDFFSRYILEEIDRVGISRDLLLLRERPLRTISVCLAHEGERGFVSFTDAQDEPGEQRTLLDSSVNHVPGAQPSALSNNELHRLLDGCDFRAAFLYALPTISPLLDILEAHNARIFFDTGWDPQVLSDPRLPSVIRRGDGIMPNQIEAEYLTKSAGPEEAVRALAELVPTAIVKVGSAGVIACQRGELRRCPAFPVERVVDTTGAGDAFNAGFIYGTLKGYLLEEALCCGTICGSLSTTAITGTAAVPSADELERLRCQAWPAC